VAVGKRRLSVGMVNEVSAARASSPPAGAVREGVRLRRAAPAAPNWRAGDHSHGRARDAARWLALLAPEHLPAGVERVVNDEQSKWYRLRLICPLRAILEIEIWQGELWAHLAITGRNAAPAEAELGYCRDLFLGDRKAIQVLPRKLEQAEAGASRTVHLYAPLESDALPSFSRNFHPTFLED
jgi:hypothetical protein